MTQVTLCTKEIPYNDNQNISIQFEICTIHNLPNYLRWKLLLIMANFANIFVTVGTTQFDDLVEIIASDNILALLHRIQCKILKIQIGNGKWINETIIERAKSQYEIKIECYNFKCNILSDIMSSDLVISHAGAGSCIEVLTSKKPLIVVVNDKLMNNHQTELAQQLFIDGHLLYCSPQSLAETLTNVDEKLLQLKPYEAGHNNMKKFINHLNTIMGFE